MLFKDSFLLEKAYLSISQPVPSVPSDEETIPGTEELVPNEQPIDGAIDQAPQIDNEVASHNPEAELSVADEGEEDTMAVDNLNSVRESAMKIAQFWEQGGHLEPWQQQKLAIVMQYLADIARSLR